ncbi:MAG: carboxyl transferase domain-containing protein [Actinomycetota bacterium]
MALSSVLVANRGEIAIRITRAAAGLDLRAVTVHTADDAASQHARAGDETVALPGRGVAGYLDIDAVIAAATDAGCDAVHPGYGFLAENAELARRCAAAGLTFVGPSPEALELFGDKGRARAAADDADVPVLAGFDRAVTLDEARAFLDLLGPGGSVMVKAVAGGGGRGTRAVTSPDDLDEAWERCTSEATAAFGRGDLYVEQLVHRARHLEVQVVGDHTGAVIHLGERECSAQRRHQKIVELAPAIGLAPDVRAALHTHAVRLAAAAGYTSLGTFEFLLDADRGELAFIEANARLQVEHTVTEEVTGVDLVRTQLQLAGGATLADLDLAPGPHGAAPVEPRGCAIQLRVNTELMGADGTVKPTGGTLRAYEPPGGPGVRVDGYGYAGYTTNPAFDSLLAKVIVHDPAPDGERALRGAIGRAARAVDEFRIDGVATNRGFLRRLLGRPELAAGEITTRFVDEHAADLAPPPEEVAAPSTTGTGGDAAAAGRAGAQVDTADPLALFAHDRATREASAAAAETATDGAALVAADGPDGTVGFPTPIQGTIVSVTVGEGDAVQPGSTLVVVEAMKMEHVVTADRVGIVRAVRVAEGDVILEGFPIVFIEEADVEVGAIEQDERPDPDHVRDDLGELYERRSYTLDENRPDAVARRRKTGQFTARENLAALVDPGSFQEYGPLAIAAQRARRTEQWLREKTPADGLIGGLATVNADLFGPEAARCMAITYDYTVLAGTQGGRNHFKKDRLFDVATRYQLPIVFFTEGGGGRPGDTDSMGSIGMEVPTFTMFSKLSGLVPLVGLNSGRCFAGNTAILACCDVIIATRDSTVGMGGPAMIEGGGLGVYTPEEVAPMSMQVPNGVIDILVEDDAEMVEVGKKYLSYFQGSLDGWEAPDQREMRHIVPENRVRMYDVREVIDTLADVDSVLEIRKDFGVGIITALIRIEGRPMGLIANNPHHLAGAIDSDGADKGARFLQLCDAFDLPVVSIMDCPGIMVGPDAEREALVRHCARMFNTGANLQVPLFGVIIRKAYGLGVQAMCGGSSMAPMITVAWPTAEFAGMNIEGSVKLGYRNDLAALETAEERKDLFDKMTAKAYERARAVNAGSNFGIDDVIDPAETRDWIVAGLRSLPPAEPRVGKRRPYIDTW